MARWLAGGWRPASRGQRWPGGCVGRRSGQALAEPLDLADMGFSLVGVSGDGEHGPVSGGVQDEDHNLGPGVPAGQGEDPGAVGLRRGRPVAEPAVRAVRASAANRGDRRGREGRRRARAAVRVPHPGSSISMRPVVVVVSADAVLQSKARRRKEDAHVGTAGGAVGLRICGCRSVTTVDLVACAGRGIFDRRTAMTEP
jgi:hypothetical protein